MNAPQDRPGYEVMRDGTARKFQNVLGGAPEDLQRLVDHVHRWSTIRDASRCAGRITLADVESAVGFNVCAPEDFLDWCRDQVRAELRAFVGDAAGPAFYIQRDNEMRLAGLLDAGPVVKEDWVGILPVRRPYCDCFWRS